MNYDELLAPAAKAMRPSGIRKFFDLAADMPHCISLGVGEPDFKTPWSVRDAGIRSLELGRTKYTANSGLKELRGEICNYLQRRFDLHYKEENILVTVGGSEAIDLTIRAVVQPGGNDQRMAGRDHPAPAPGRHQHDARENAEELRAAVPMGRPCGSRRRRGQPPSPPPRPRATRRCSRCWAPRAIRRTAPSAPPWRCSCRRRSTGCAGARW